MSHPKTQLPPVPASLCAAVRIMMDPQNVAALRELLADIERWTKIDQCYVQLFATALERRNQGESQVTYLLAAGFFAGLAVNLGAQLQPPTEVAETADTPAAVIQ